MENVQLPTELIGVITILVTVGMSYLVTSGFKGLGEAFGKDFSNVAKAIAAIVAAGAVSTVLGVINFTLDLIPAEYAPIAQQVLALIVLVLSAMGVQRERKARK